MKTIVSIFASILLSSSFSFAGENPVLAREIRTKLSVDLSRVDLNPWQKDFVKVSFHIVDGEIEILQIKGTLRELESLLQEELQKMHIESPYEEGVTYAYRFTFEKI
jgi:hypothetical protein